MLEGGCGIIIQPRDIDVLKMALEAQLGDPLAAAEMGQKACAKVHELYSMIKIWADLKKVWRG